MSFAAVSRIAVCSARQFATRSLPAVAMASKMAVPRVGMTATRAFSVTALNNQKADLTAADSQLASVLKKEIEIESTAESEPEDTKWLEKSGFKLVVKDGSDEVELVKKEGGEIIHVFFSVSDITNGDAYDFNEEGFEGEANEGEGEEDLPIDVPPIRANIVVEKGTSALTIESVIQSNLLLVENVTPYESVDVALANSADSDYLRRSVYQGPAFANLDESLQSALEQYLDSRGIDAELASFISDFSNVRENKEYILWLNKVKNFVEA